MKEVHRDGMFNAWSHLLLLRLPPLFRDALCTKTLSVTGMSTAWSPEEKDGTLSSSTSSLHSEKSSVLILEVEQDREIRPRG